MIASLIDDLRHALRSLLRNPGFFAIALLTLALGVGSVSAVFSVVNGVLLKPLPYPESEHSIRINRVQPPFSGPVSRQLLGDWRETTQAQFTALGAFVGAVVSLSGSGEAERLFGYRVTPEFWQVMGLAPQAGRYFGQEEEASNERVVVLLLRTQRMLFAVDPRDRQAVVKALAALLETLALAAVVPVRRAPRVEPMALPGQNC